MASGSTAPPKMYQCTVGQGRTLGTWTLHYRYEAMGGEQHLIMWQWVKKVLLYQSSCHLSGTHHENGH